MPRPLSIAGAYRPRLLGLYAEMRLGFFTSPLD
jgi:hypothetical protein